MFCRSFFVCPFSFGHCVVLLRFTDSDYPFGIFKLLLIMKMTEHARTVLYRWKKKNYFEEIFIFHNISLCNIAFLLTVSHSINKHTYSLSSAINGNDALGGNSKRKYYNKKIFYSSHCARYTCALTYLNLLKSFFLPVYTMEKSFVTKCKMLLPIHCISTSLITDKGQQTDCSMQKSNMNPPKVNI